MRYPNAHAGVKKVYIAEILTLLMSVMVLLGAVTAAVGIGAQSAVSDKAVTGTLLGGGALILIAGALGLIAMVINLIGLRQGGKDEPGMRYAFVMAVLSLVSSVAGEAINMNGTSTLGTLVSDLSGLFNFFVVAFVIASNLRLADLLNNQKMAAKGNRLSGVILLGLFAAFLCGVIPKLFSSSMTETITEILAVAAALCAVVAYIAYLSFLKGAIKMTAE